MKKTVILTILAFAFGMVFGSSLMAQSKEPIKIGVMYDFAGGCHMYSEAGIKGIKMALEEINAKGGILGKKLVTFKSVDLGTIALIEYGYRSSP